MKLGKQSMVGDVQVVVISEEDNMMLEDQQMDDARQEQDRQVQDTSLFQLESFKFLRVLLVEFDDSTRSIIAALLRKSGYRVVSVADGLKAWETLKGTTQTIDLVLAEVQLPSISGFSLLTMIMGDDIFRNIPVIMMSSYDAVNLVFKCMLKGAADFLVKPLRKNELRNLWQHVWRRHSVNNAQHTTSQQKTEAVDESYPGPSAAPAPTLAPKENNQSSGKGSDAQSSCTKPDMEDDDIDMQNMQSISQQKSIDSMKTPKEGESVKEEYALQVTESEVDGRPKPQQEANVNVDTFYGNCDQLKPSREAIDLIGSFDNHVEAYNTQFQGVEPSNMNVNFNSTSARKGCSSTPGLELSLSRSHFSEIQGVGEIQTLKHSNASAFSWYNQRTVQSTVCTESKEDMGISSKHQLDNALTQTDEVPQQGIISVPLPIRSTRVDDLHSGYGSVWPQMYYTPVGPSPLQSSNSVTQQEGVFHLQSSDQPNPENYEYHPSSCKPTKATQHKQRQCDAVHISVATSVTSSLCNSSSSNINSSGCGSVCDGSNGNETSVNVVGAATTGRGNDISDITPEGLKGVDSLCSNQREAALNKFRLKRKDRCFEKKVRYQSRKRLAEQRPRVKGQFVRQVPS